MIGHDFIPFWDADNDLVCAFVTGPGGTGAPPQICGLGKRAHSKLDLTAALDALDLVDEAFNMLHFTCENPDHAEVYQKLAVALGYKEHP